MDEKIIENIATKQLYYIYLCIGISCLNACS